MNPLTFVRGVGAVAIRYGIEESILLDTIMFWTRENRSRGENFRNGRWWTYNSVHGMAEIFPWWSEKQIRRIISSCKEQGAILIGNYNQDGRDRTVWYSPSDELWALYSEPDMGKCNLPNGQMQVPEGADTSAQMGEPLPCLNHVDNTPLPPKGGRGGRKRRKPPRAAPDWQPERFAGLWAYYPSKGRKNKQDAMDAWDELRPDDAMIAVIGRALKRLKATDDWQRGVGIPYVATFLRGARWTDADELDGPEDGQPPSGVVERRVLPLWT